MKKKIRKLVIWILIIAIAAAAVLFGLSRRTKFNFDEETARTQNIETFYTFSGNLEADSFKVVPAINRSSVREWKYEEGDKVEKDEVIMTSKSGTQMKAPMDGTISDIYVDEGEDYTIGDILYRIADYDHPLVRIRIDEYDVSAITKGMQVDVKIQATGHVLTGSVRRIAQEATVSNDLAYYEVIVDVPQDGTLVMGMTCEVIVPRDNVQNATTISMEAVQYDEDGKPFVYCYNRNNELIQQSVLLGINDGSIVEIKDGLRSGETVLIPPTFAFPFPMMSDR
ncbi:MAG: HlyD family efflux transporter periplasmic adaptor subunit [Clostridiales bacterium]|nr:HlyD family efflux transporter periplasmic adaptor subunit [Clostridiales bacterium]